MELQEGWSWKQPWLNCPECHSHGHALLDPAWTLTTAWPKHRGWNPLWRDHWGFRQVLAFGHQHCCALPFSLAFPSPGDRGQRGRAAVAHTAGIFEPSCFMLTHFLLSLIKKLISVLDWAQLLSSVLFSVFSLYSFSIFRR